MVRVAGRPTKHSVAARGEALDELPYENPLGAVAGPKKRNTEIPWDTNDWRWGFNFGIARWLLDKVTAANFWTRCLLIPRDSTGRSVSAESQTGLKTDYLPSDLQFHK